MNSKAWKNEADKKEFAYKGYRCLIRRAGCNHLCGYVAVEKNHELYGTHYNDYDYFDKQTHSDFISIHGMITYTEYSNKNVYACSPNEEIFWIGFDCAHHFDYCPTYPDICQDPKNYKTIEYVENEIKKLVNIIDSF